MKSIAGVLLFLTAAPAFAQDEHVGVRVREWFARMSGSIEADDGSGTSDRVDLSELGLADRHLTHEIQAYLRLPVVGRIYGGWWRAHDTGSEVITRSIDFEGVPFSVSDRVESEITLDVAYLTYEFAFLTIPVGDVLKLELGAQLGARVMHGAGSIEDTVTMQRGEGSGTAGLPVLGVHVTAELFKYVRAEVEVAGLTFSYGDWHVNYLEASGEVVAQPLPWLFAGLGYKHVTLDIRHDGSDKFNVDVGVAGLYITFGVRF